MNQLKRTLLTCALLLPWLVLSGCKSTPKQDYDVNYDFSRLKSFTQVAPQQTTDQLSSDRIKQSISSALTAQGYVQKDKDPDFIVTYGFRVDDKPSGSGFSIGLGAGSWGKSGGGSLGTSVAVPVGSDSAKVQTIQIDVIDPNTKKLIWRGSDKFNFDEGGKQKVEETNNTVNNILALFPPKK